MARAENIAFTFLLARTRPPPIFTLTHTHHISNFPNLVVYVCAVKGLSHLFTIGFSSRYWDLMDRRRAWTEFQQYVPMYLNTIVC